MQVSAGLPRDLVGNPSLAPAQPTASPPSVPMPSFNLVGEFEVLAVPEDSVVDRVDTVGPLQPMQGVLFVQPSVGGYLGSSEGLPAGIAPLVVCSCADFEGSAHQMPNGFAGKPFVCGLITMYPRCWAGGASPF